MNTDVSARHGVPVERAARIVAAAQRATIACQRPDLGERLGGVATRLDSQHLSAVVIGEFKQGKSSLVNALVSAPICAVDDDIATAVITVVHDFDERRAVAFVGDPDDLDQVEKVSIEPDGIRNVLLTGQAGEGLPVRSVEIGMPNRLLEQGLRLIDTPGLGGLDSSVGRASLALLPLADVALFVSDAAQPLTASELEALTRACDRAVRVLFVQTKIDVYPQWRDVITENRATLLDRGINISMVAVSSKLQQLAIKRNDRSLHEESGMQAVVNYLRTAARSDVERARIADAGVQVRDSLAQLRPALAAEKSALQDPARAAELEHVAAAEAESLARLRTETARWSTTLNDAINDLTSVHEADLRTRMTGLLDEVTEALEEGDPVDLIDELVPMVERRLIEEIMSNHDLIRSSAEEVTAKVDAVFDDEVHAAVPDVEGLDDATFADLLVDFDERPSSGAAVLTAIRGSYGGMLMFTGVVSILGPAVAGAMGPAGIAVGAALGRKALRDERDRQVKQRRVQARTSIKKHMDAVQSKAQQHNRSTVRAIQRSLRDTNSSRAKELIESASQAAKAAHIAAQRSGPERAARLERVDKLMSDLDGLARAAEGLA